MPEQRNPIDLAIARDGKAIGTWITLSDTVGVEALGGLGFDWLVFDLEHTAITARELLSMCQSVSRFSTVPLVRIRGLVESEVKTAWASGASGVMAPNVMSRSAAETLVEWCRYPPLGTRGVGGARSWGPARQSSRNTLEERNEDTLVAVQIEHMDAISRLDEILSVEGIDICYVGLDDLYASAGVDQRNAGPVQSIDEALEQILQVSIRYGVTPGIHSQTAQSLMDRRSEGWRFLGLGEDLDFMYQGARDALAVVR